MEDNIENCSNEESQPDEELESPAQPESSRIKIKHEILDLSPDESDLKMDAVPKRRGRQKKVLVTRPPSKRISKPTIKMSPVISQRRRRKITKSKKDIASIKKAQKPAVEITKKILKLKPTVLKRNARSKRRKKRINRKLPDVTKKVEKDERKVVAQDKLTNEKDDNPEESHAPLKVKEVKKRSRPDLPKPKVEDAFAKYVDFTLLSLPLAIQMSAVCEIQTILMRNGAEQSEKDFYLLNGLVKIVHQSEKKPLQEEDTFILPI